MKSIRERCVLILLIFAPVSLLGEMHSITGEWQGAIATQHLIVKIDEAADGSLSGKLTAVDQGNVTIPLIVSFVNGTLRLELKREGAVYEAKPNDDGSELVGTWQQSGHSFALTLRRPGAAAKSTLQPRTVGSIAFEPCLDNGDALCGKYEVYENRALQNGRKIALNIMLLPSLAPRPPADPWFAIAGGPGQSAVQAYPVLELTAKIRQQRDVVLVDQRGTGGSNPLPCQLRDSNDPQAVFADLFPLEKVRACRAELEKKADLTQYTTTIAVEDLDDVRRAMGYDKLNLFGDSYGSRLALVYLRRHPEHVRTVTLQAIAPPDYKLFVGFPKTTRASIEGVLRLCASDDACHKALPDLEKEFKAVSARLAKAPAEANLNGQTITISDSAFINGTRSMLYIPELLSRLPLLVHRAYGGDWTPFVRASLFARRGLDRTVLRGMQFSVVCAEDVPGLETKTDDPRFRMMQEACHEWPHGAVPTDFHAPIRSSVPALLISGALDPVTPPEASKRLPGDLRNSRSIVVKEGTHTTASPCIDGLIVDFVNRGSAADLDVSCVSQIHIPAFVTQESGL